MISGQIAEHNKELRREDDNILHNRYTEGSAMNRMSIYQDTIDEMETLAPLIDMLRQYLAAFDRDIPDEMSSQFQRSERRLKRVYATTEMSVMVDKVIEAYDMENMRPILRWYKEAVDELDKQFFVIRKARRELFDFDFRGCPGIVLEEQDMHLDEPAGWGKNEYETRYPEINCLEH